MGPLGLLQKVFDLGGRGAARVGRGLMRVVTSVIQGVGRVLLQSCVVQKVFIEHVAAWVMGVGS